MSPLALIRKFTKKNKKIYFISDSSDFHLLNKSLNENKVLSIDTEFDWRSTYFPNLSLLQIGFSNEIYIIDCLACNPTNLVKEFLESISHLKIFHSSRSDATILSKCHERVEIKIDPYEFKGSWNKINPFKNDSTYKGGKILIITRARVKFQKLLEFLISTSKASKSIKNH